VVVAPLFYVVRVDELKKDVLVKLIMFRRFIYSSTPPDKWWVKFGGWEIKHYVYHNSNAPTFKTLEFVYDSGVMQAVKILDEEKMRAWWLRVQQIRNSEWQLKATDDACMALGTYNNDTQRLHQYFKHPLDLCRWDAAGDGMICTGELPAGEEISDREAVMAYLLTFETVQDVHVVDGWKGWLKSWFV